MMAQDKEGEAVRVHLVALALAIPGTESRPNIPEK